MKHPLSKTSGFSLLEVLITMLVLSIGLLGIAGLQAVSLRNSHVSSLRSQAAWLAADMSDRMRANLAGLSGYENIVPENVYSDPGCINTGCTPAQMAQYDAYQWMTALAAQLPSGTGSVKKGAANGTTDCAGNPVTDTNYYVIKINWQELDKSVATPHCFLLSVRPL